MDKQQLSEDHAQRAGTSSKQSDTDIMAAAVLQSTDQLQLDQSATCRLCLEQTAAAEPAAQTQPLPAEPVQALQAALAMPGCEREAHNIANDAGNVSHLFQCPLTKVQPLNTATFRTCLSVTHFKSAAE